MAWYCLKTRPGKEVFAVEGLRRQGYETCLPKIQKTIKRGRGHLAVLRPLFPGYVFAALSETNRRWQPMRNTRGVTQIIAFGDQPSQVPVELIQQFQEMSDETGKLRFQSELDVGDRIRVIGGTFDNWVGELVSKPDSERATLLLDMLSRKVEVTLDRAQLILAG